MDMRVNEAEAGPALTVVRIENDFDFLSVEYNTLFQRSGASAFQSPLWLHSIYTVLAPKLGARPHVIAVRHATSGALMMIIPLVIQRALEVDILQAADLGVSDYNCIVTDPQTLSELARDAHFLTQIQKPIHAGDVLIFRKIQRSAAATAAILGRGKQARNENSGYEIALSGNTFEEWQKATLTSRFRKGTNRRLRKLIADHKSVEFVTFTTPADIEKAIRFIGENRPARFKDDILQQKPYLDFYLHHALAGAASGEAVTTGMIVDGVLASVDFGIVADNTYVSILCSAKIEEYGQYAPGVQSLLALIRQRHELGEARFDFGIGSSRQKSDFAATEIPLYNFTVASSMSGQAVSLVYNQAKPLKNLLRKLIGWVR